MFIPPVWEPFQGLIRPNPMLPGHVLVAESEVINMPQRKQSICMDDRHISSPMVFSVSSSCSELYPASESESTNLPQNEQSNCMDDYHEHIPSLR